MMFDGLKEEILQKNPTVVLEYFRSDSMYVTILLRNFVCFSKRIKRFFIFIKLSMYQKYDAVDALVFRVVQLRAIPLYRYSEW